MMNELFNIFEPYNEELIFPSDKSNIKKNKIIKKKEIKKNIIYYQKLSSNSYTLLYELKRANLLFVDLFHVNNR